MKRSTVFLVVGMFSLLLVCLAALLPALHRAGQPSVLRYIEVINDTGDLVSIRVFEEDRCVFAADSVRESPAGFRILIFAGHSSDVFASTTFMITTWNRKGEVYGRRFLGTECDHDGAVFRVSQSRFISVN